MKNPFTEHPSSVGESYWQHLCFAASCSSRLVLAGIAGLIHAILPFLFIDTASNIIAKLAAKFCIGARREGFVCKVCNNLPTDEIIEIKKETV